MTGDSLFSQAGLSSVRRGTPLPEPAHWTCNQHGKFDCLFDEAVSQLAADDGTGEGHVEAPCAWFDAIFLDPGAEAGLIEHYGTRWIIARENAQGFFWVETFDTEQFRDERLESLRAVWAEWDEGVL